MKKHIDPPEKDMDAFDLLDKIYLLFFAAKKRTVSDALLAA